MARPPSLPLLDRRYAPWLGLHLTGSLLDLLFVPALALLAAGALEVGWEASLGSPGLPLVLALGGYLAGHAAAALGLALRTRHIDPVTAARHSQFLGLVAVLLAVPGLVFGIPALLLASFPLFGLRAGAMVALRHAILGQILRPEELSAGIARFHAAFAFALLLGLLGLALLWSGAITVGGLALALVGTALLIGLLTCALPRSAVPTTGTVDPPPPSLPALLEELGKHRAVVNALLGIGWFAFFAALLVLHLPTALAGAEPGLADPPALHWPAVGWLAVGLLLGALACEPLSHRTVEIGLVPLGAIGMGLALFLLPPFGSAAAIATGLLLIGISAAFFLVPLRALIVQRTSRLWRIRSLALGHLLATAFAALALVLALLLQRFAGLAANEVLLLLVVLHALVVVWIFWLVPEFVMRFLVWLLSLVIYRIEVRGIEEHLPPEGPALVVCNHVGYLDSLLLGGAVPRPLRFVMHHSYYHLPVLHWVFRAARVIPIASSRDDPALLEQAFDRIDQALAEGEVVGLFPEGGLTRDGEISPFRPGLERILARRPVPVVPVALKNLWRSMFSRRDSVLGRLRLPRRFRARIGIEAGPAIPGHEANAERLEEAVRALRGDAA